MKTEKNTGTIAFRFRQVLLYIIRSGQGARRQDEQPVGVGVLEDLDLSVKGCKRKST